MQIINGTHVYLMWLSLTPATHETYYNSFRYQNTLKQNKENMASWSDENATTAYLPALKMGKRDKELDVAEFISALAAGKNAQLVVIASASIDGSTILSLVAAAHQTGGNVICILPTKPNVCASRNSPGPYADCVKFVIGDAKILLSKDYRGRFCTCRLRSS
uniref:Uncharacterized protein n=1 Tax=Populus trichocarpa TaxID=3694 RepID=A0A3N7EIY5_POPTR|eukprot:XP_024450993.1 uncharacterized protein LOC7453970 [Populus trichocarpa]